MATATERTFTPEELLAIADRPTPELIDGRMVEREPMGQEADEILINIASILKAFAKTALPGVVNGPEGGLQIFPDRPNKVRYPDVAFTRRERLPEGKAARGHSRVAPDLVVVVISPNDLAADLRGKLRDFHDAGIALIWVVNPDTRDVVVIRGDGTAAYLKEGDTLDGGAALPGLSCPVAALFE